MMELLLNHNANVHARDAQGRTAMHFAAAVGHAHLITVSYHICCSVHQLTHFIAVVSEARCRHQCSECKAREQPALRRFS
jgi:hypothetical protein